MFSIPGKFIIFHHKRTIPILIQGIVLNSLIKAKEILGMSSIVNDNSKLSVVGRTQRPMLIQHRCHPPSE